MRQRIFYPDIQGHSCLCQYDIALRANHRPCSSAASLGDVFRSATRTEPRRPTAGGGENPLRRTRKTREDKH